MRRISWDGATLLSAAAIVRLGGAGVNGAALETKLMERLQSCDDDVRDVMPQPTRVEGL